MNLTLLDILWFFSLAGFVIGLLVQEPDPEKDKTGLFLSALVVFSAAEILLRVGF